PRCGNQHARRGLWHGPADGGPDHAAARHRGAHAAANGTGKSRGRRLSTRPTERQAETTKGSPEHHVIFPHRKPMKLWQQARHIKRALGQVSRWTLRKRLREALHQTVLQPKTLRFTTS